MSVMARSVVQMVHEAAKSAGTGKNPTCVMRGLEEFPRRKISFTHKALRYLDGGLGCLLLKVEVGVIVSKYVCMHVAGDRIGKIDRICYEKNVRGGYLNPTCDLRVTQETL